MQPGTNDHCASCLNVISQPYLQQAIGTDSATSSSSSMKGSVRILPTVTLAVIALFTVRHLFALICSPPPYAMAAH